jgi:hypothetical protein
MTWMRTSPRRRREPEPPPLGNGREDELSDEKLARSAHEGAPESQGAFADEDYGVGEQGAYGDEDFDPSYSRDTDPTAVDPDDALPGDGEHEGPGRGVRGGDWVREDPLEPPDELARKAVAEEAEERRRDDLAVADDVVDVLTDALPGIRELHVTSERGEITLEGVVPDRATEVAAIRLAARIPGVVDVVPRLRVAES